MPAEPLALTDEQRVALKAYARRWQILPEPGPILLQGVTGSG